MKKFFNLIMNVIAVLYFACGIVRGQSVIIDMNSEFQHVAGFGAANIRAWVDDLNDDQVIKAFGNSPGEMGFSILRVRIPSDTTQFSFEVPTARSAYDHGATLIASPWSPPAYMKSNNNLVGGYLLPENYEAYADHLLNFARLMSDEGAPLYAVSLQNEPDITVSYESCDWTASQFINFLEQQGPRFDTLKVIAPESFQFRRPLSDSILNDPEAVQHVDIIGGHIYGGGLFDYPLARNKGKEVWMTEHLTGSTGPAANTWDLALELATEITSCMKANFNAYIWWYLRRFYGPMDDAGNITHKGYVMSHFSKFIRPGAVRVDALVLDVQNIGATAYKTDSTLVIVIVNRNAAARNLSFSILNDGFIDTLTKFTSTQTKTLINDGGISVTGGMFNVSVEPLSITTLTTYAGSAGKFGNSPPVANAGDDLDLVDNDLNGYETVVFDATESYDPDGSINNYSWSMNGIQIAWEPVFERNLNVGRHVFVLTVTDDDGIRDFDTIRISVSSEGIEELWLEAECGRVGSVWNKMNHSGASEGKYIAGPAGVEFLPAASEDTANLAIYDFHLTNQGLFKVWGRVISPSANDDSYWIKMDQSNWVMWNNIPSNSQWHWDDVHDQGESSVMTYLLDTGYHTLYICIREDGTWLDKILITNAGTIPDGFGESADNCPEDTAILNMDLITISEVQIFPNPASSEIYVHGDKSFTRLEITNMAGDMLLRKTYGMQVNSITVPLNLAKGVYLLRLTAEDGFIVRKFIVAGD